MIILMKRIEHIAMIAHDMGRIFEFLGIASLLPFLVLVIFREWNMLLPMASVPVVFLASGGLLSRLSYKDLEPTFSGYPYRCCVLVACDCPYWFPSLHVRFAHELYRQLFLSLCSGWTGTGFSMITSLDTTPKTLLFWRSFTQWIGGIGIIAFGISLRRKTRVSLFRLYRAEGREEGTGITRSIYQPEDVDDLPCADLCVHRSYYVRGHSSLGFD